MLLCVFIETEFWWKHLPKPKAVNVYVLLPLFSNKLDKQLGEAETHNTAQDPLAKKIHVGFGWGVSKQLCGT